MTKTKIIMAMPCTVMIADDSSLRKQERVIDNVFSYFQHIDETFSAFKKESVISRINRKKTDVEDASLEVRKILSLSEATKKETNGYFDIQKNDGSIDPTGLVKGWAIYQGSEILKREGFKNFYVEIAGDIQTQGLNQQKKPWEIGIRNPFEKDNIIQVVRLAGEGVATSGSYMQGSHIYNPLTEKEAKEILSLTVIGPNVFEADRFATAAFAMGKAGIDFIERHPKLEGYAIDHKGIATFTSGFKKYVGVRLSKI